MRLYNYFFFKIFQILTVFDESPVFATVMVLCWLFLFNSSTIIIYFLGHSRFTIYFFTYIVGINVFSSIAHFSYFYYKSRYLKIIERYENESKRSLTIGIIGTIVFVIASILIFFNFTAPNVGGILKH